MSKICRAFRWILTYKNEDSWMPSMAVKSVHNYIKNDKKYLKVKLYNIVDKDFYSIEEFEQVAFNLKKLTLRHLDGCGEIIVQELFENLKVKKKNAKLDYENSDVTTTTYLFEYDYHFFELPEPIEKPAENPVKPQEKVVAKNKTKTKSK